MKFALVFVVFLIPVFGVNYFNQMFYLLGGWCSVNYVNQMFYLQGGWCSVNYFYLLIILTKCFTCKVVGVLLNILIC